MQRLANQLPAHLYLWDNRVLYAGPALDARYRCYGSATLLIAPEGELRLHRQLHADESLICRCCVVRPGAPVFLASGGPSLLALFLDPFLHDLRALADSARQETRGILWSLDGEHQMIAFARQVLARHPACRVVQSELAGLGLPDRARLDPEKVDARVVRAVGMIRSARTRNITTEDLAAEVNLSVPRVIQLFRQYLGVSAGKYRQWHRLHATTLAIARGHTFTQASVASGFSDLAHFSNTFHSMMGIMPSRLLRSGGGVHFHIDRELASHGFSSLSGINSATSPMC
ncbi:AraC-type DNA-binding protein [Marinobacter daqiaonensis]|uniref:AraC-type DNA-binding protein n=1 Tax=Marinobacter daqiaonensis TaxID=650891 RepID=A0A1I6GGZ2_9GAMM|nr:helix-turn-helix domain-containing protein [Marinobacter daqiaonensis]SFR41454.1 AraC-type DNA-binding protein [Marinobacter daqiaonensis]